jgi:hypothetical protein
MFSESEATQSVPILLDGIEVILYKVAKGIVDSQLDMDQAALATQIKIENDETLSKYGLEAPWYHFAETEVEIKVAFHLVEEKKETKVAGKTFPYTKTRLIAAPLNANYSKNFNYDATFASTIKTKIVPIPSQIRKLSGE